jgi:hypothetical protein
VLLAAGSVAALLALKDDSDNDNKNTVTSSNTPTNQTGATSAYAEQNMRDCNKDRKVSFTTWPVPMEQLGNIVPMGQMLDGHVTPTDHIYITGVDPRTTNPNAYDIVMPADGTMTAVGAMPAQYIGDNAQQTAAEDYRIEVIHDCQYASIFIHVHQLSPTVQAAVGKLKPNEQKQLKLELKAGDKIGKVGGSVDWSLMDVTKTLTGFITPSLYQRESWKIHVIDPISVYKGDLKTQLIAKSLRTVEPYGGKIDYDQKGKLIGNWFKEGTNGYEGANKERYWDGHLSIVPGHIDPTGTILSIGNWDGKAAQFTVRGAPDTSGVSAASGVVKYEVIRTSYSGASSGQQAKGMKLINDGTPEGTVLFQVMDGEKLKVETFPGKTAAQVSGFTSKAATYVR